MSADLGNQSVISPVDASNGSGTAPSWLGSAAANTIDDAGRALQGSVAREWECRSFPTATGTAPAFVVTMTVAPAAYRSGQVYTFTAHAAAVGSETLNANTLGAKNIKKIVAGVKTAIAANDWYTGDKLAFVYDGTDMVWTNRGTGDLSTYAVITLTPQLASANAFTAVQTIGIDNAGTNTVTDILKLKHTSSGTAAASFGAGLLYQLEDGAGNTEDAASVDAVWVDATNASEDSKISFKTMVAGVAKAEAVAIAQGLYMAGVTGGDKGVNTINAASYYLNGTLVSPVVIKHKATLDTRSSTTLTDDSDLTFAMAASTNYLIKFTYKLSNTGGAATGFKIGLSGPGIGAGSVMFTAAMLGNDGANTFTNTLFSASATGVITFTQSGTANDNYLVTGEVNWRNGVTAGTFVLQTARQAGSGQALFGVGSTMTYQVY